MPYETLQFMAGLLGSVAALLVFSFVLKKIGNEKIRCVQQQLAVKEELARLAVSYAEQAWEDLKGPEKYDKAAEYMSIQAKKLGISLTREEIKGLIEAALRGFKDQFGESWAASQ